MKNGLYDQQNKCEASKQPLAILSRNGGDFDLERHRSKTAKQKQQRLKKTVTVIRSFKVQHGS